MDKLVLLQQVLSCIKDCKTYQNTLKDSLLQVQQKLRWIALTRKKSVQKSEKSKRKFKRKRIPYHPSYQLLNLIKTKLKRPSIPPFTHFTPQDLLSLNHLHNLHPNDWSSIAIALSKSPLDCFRNFTRQNSQNSSNKLQWTASEDSQLSEAVKLYGENNWSEVSNCVDGKRSSQCYHRYMKTLSPRIKRGKWDLTEDIKLILGAKIFGKNWVRVAGLIPNRTDIQCRERYCNVLSPNINSTGWSCREDIKLQLGILMWGKKWSKIARVIEGRTDNQCWRRSKILVRGSLLLRGLIILRCFRPKVSEGLQGFARELYNLEKLGNF